jgi:N-acetylglutamate synthase-like GNAT family acetyltransferase
MKIVKATPSNSQELTALTIRSKAHWGYSPEQILDWTDVLTVSEDYISEASVYMLRDGEQLIGYYALLTLSPDLIKLDNIFIDPPFIGKGFGKRLMIDLFEKAKASGATKMTLDSDPNAEQFYKDWGFKVVGKLETSIQDRYLPIMEMEIGH